MGSSTKEPEGNRWHATSGFDGKEIQCSPQGCRRYLLSRSATRIWEKPPIKKGGIGRIRQTRKVKTWKSIKLVLSEIR